MRATNPALWCLALGLLALAAFPAAADDTEQEERPPIVLESSREGRARRAAAGEAWTRLAAVHPELLDLQDRLRRSHRRWRWQPGGAACREVRSRLAAVDRRVLLDGAHYLAALAAHEALDGLARAAGACLERRYFEFGYRLDRAAAALERLDDARPRPSAR